MKKQAAKTAMMCLVDVNQSSTGMAGPVQTPGVVVMAGVVVAVMAVV